MPLIQGLFRDHIPETGNRETVSFVTESGELLSLPEKIKEFPDAFLHPRMNSAVVCPVFRGLEPQGILYLNSLYENHYSTHFIHLLEKHCRVDRLRILDLQEALS